MPKSYWTKIQTPNGLKYFRADEVTDELMQKIKDEADDVFYVEYGTTTFVNALAAYNAGKTVLLLKTSGTLTRIYTLVSASSTTLRFSKVDGQLQDTVSLNSSDQYSDTHTILAKSDNVMKTASAEIAPEYYDLCTEYQIEHKFPIPVGTLVTYLDNTSSDVLQYLYKSKVEIGENDYASSDPIAAPAKWDKIHVADELGKVAYVDILQTPFSEVLALYNQGKHIVGRNGYEFYPLIGYSEAYGAITGFSFRNINGPVIYTWRVTSDGPSETNNWVTPPDIYFNAWIGTSAPLYDETHTYSVGDVVSHYTDLYRCTTDIDVAEPWTEAHWTRTTMAAELKVAVFECRDNGTAQNFFTGPTYAELEAARTSGKTIVLLVHYGFDTVVDRYLEMTYYGFGRGYFDYRFTNPETGAVLQFKGLYSDTETHVWSRASAYDDALSSTSVNAVQNKTLYAIINDLQTRVSALEGN